MKKINEWIALHMTMLFGTMWITYLFFLYGFLPIVFPSHMNQLLYWSNTVQLWSLPLLMVGQNVMGRAAEQRAQQDHETLLKEFQVQNEEMAKLQQILDELQKIKES